MKKKFVKAVFWLLIAIILLYNPVSVRIYTLFAAMCYHLDSKLFYQQIKSESSFRALAISKANAIGPGQIKTDTHKYISPDIPTIFLWLPFVNICVSAKYMRYLLDKYNHNWSVALAAYNWGETNVDKKLKGIKIERNKDYKKYFKNIKESYHYIKKVMK